MSALSYHGTKLLRIAIRDAMSKRDSFLYYMTQPLKPALFAQYSSEVDHAGDVAGCLIGDLGGMAGEW